MTAPARPDALARLMQREEVLQICYWMQGEGFGDHHDAKSLGPFLQAESDVIAATLTELSERGDLEASDGRFRLTEQGRREAGRLFVEGFADFQRQGHGECDAGCCDGDDHSRCGDECPLH